MTEGESKQLLFIIESLPYGQITIKKESGKIVHIIVAESIKLDNVAVKRNH